MSNPFIKSVEEADSLLVKAKLVAKGRKMEAAGIDWLSMHSYAKIARRSRDDWEFGLNSSPYEAGPAIGAFVRGFF